MRRHSATSDIACQVKRYVNLVNFLLISLFPFRVGARKRGPVNTYDKNMLHIEACKYFFTLLL